MRRRRKRVDKLFLISAMIFTLGNPNYTVRENSYRALVSYNNEYDIRWLLHSAQDSPDLEIARRSKLIIEEYYNLPINLSTLPTIEYHDGVDDNLWQQAFQMDYFVTYDLKTAGFCWERMSNKVTDYSRHNTMRYATSLFNHGYSRKDIIRLIDRMYRNEQFNRRFEPPIPEYLKYTSSVRGLYNKTIDALLLP